MVRFKIIELLGFNWCAFKALLQGPCTTFLFFFSFLTIFLLGVSIWQVNDGETSMSVFEISIFQMRISNYGLTIFLLKKWNREWNPVSKETKLSINIQFQSCLILHLPLSIIHPPYKNNFFQLIWYTKQNQKRIYPITEFWWRRCPYWHKNED